MAWGELDNGALLAAAEIEFDALITIDQNLRHQQNMAGRRLAVFVLPTTSWPKLRLHPKKSLLPLRRFGRPIR